MENQFIPYELSLKIKELGFDEPCLAWYHPNMYLVYSITKDKDSIVNAPLWQQALDFLLVKLNRVYIHYHRDQSGRINHGVTGFITSFSNKEECLEKLIEIVKNK